MGILDEAIREHLELKRQHGADETELKGLEDEAFGEADRPAAVEPSSAGEAETQIISPGSSVTTPAGEGDQLDKVFEATRQREADAAAKAAREAEDEAQDASEPQASSSEQPTAEPEAATPASEAKVEPEPEATATVESPQAKPEEPEAVAEADLEPPVEEGDAGDMLEAERHHLASHPTEHYDVDAAIAEEDEIDILSESSLSDELDRALESGDLESGEVDAAPEPAPSPSFEEPESEEFDSGEFATEDPFDEPEAEEEDSSTLLYEDAATENQPVETEEADSEESETSEEEEDGEASFFDQDDPLEGTPDFLEETPEHDQLWFEQKQPKDFDFGD